MIKPPYVLFVGRISKQKGIFTLLEAADGLSAGVLLVLCAASPDTPELEQELRLEVSGRSNVLWIEEMLEQHDLVELYSHARFACPSVYELFGIINLEAMACELPVVASNVGGIPEVVVDRETGILVPPADANALTAALKAVLGDPDAARRMGKAGRERVERHFTWDHEARKTIDLYTAMLEEGR